MDAHALVVSVAPSTHGKKKLHYQLIPPMAGSLVQCGSIRVHSGGVRLATAEEIATLTTCTVCNKKVDPS